MNAHMTRLMILLGTLMVFTGDNVTAQKCFRGKAYPECRLFWITEASVLYRLNDDRFGLSNHTRSSDKLLFSFDLGEMYNLGGREAVGASISIGFEQLHEQAQIGGRLRYRRWLRRPFSFEYAPGIIVNIGGDQYKGFSNLLTISASDMVALTLRLDVMRWSRDPGYQICPYGGITLGSYLGLTAAIVSVPIVAIIMTIANQRWLQ